MRKVQIVALLVLLLFIFCGCTRENPAYVYLQKSDGTYMLYKILEEVDSSLVIDSHYRGKPITEIRKEVFYGCDYLESVTIPDTVEILGGYCFAHCENLKEIHLGANVREISSAFYALFSLEKITVSNENPYYHVENNCLIETATNTVVLGSKNSAIPDTVTAIGDRAFSGAYELKSIDLPANLQAIGEEAFAGAGFEEIEIPNSVLEIGECAFLGTPIVAIRIPDKVKELPYYIFAGCTRLERVYIGASVENIKRDSGMDAFFNTPKLHIVEVSEENPTYRSEGNCIIEREANRLIFATIDAQIPQSVQILAEGSLWEYDMYSETPLTQRTTLNIPQSVDKIEHQAIIGYTNLQSIYIPKNVTVIERAGIYIDNRSQDKISTTTIYCEAAEKPDGWHEEWLYCQGEYNVVWGYDFTQINAPEQQ